MYQYLTSGENHVVAYIPNINNDSGEMDVQFAFPSLLYSEFIRPIAYDEIEIKVHPGVIKQGLQNGFTTKIERIKNEDGTIDALLYTANIEKHYVWDAKDHDINKAKTEVVLRNKLLTLMRKALLKNNENITENTYEKNVRSGQRETKSTFVLKNLIEGKDYTIINSAHIFQNRLRQEFVHGDLEGWRNFKKYCKKNQNCKKRRSNRQNSSFSLNFSTFVFKNLLGAGRDLTMPKTELKHFKQIPAEEMQKVLSSFDSKQFVVDANYYKYGWNEAQEEKVLATIISPSNVREI